MASKNSEQQNWTLQTMMLIQLTVKLSSVSATPESLKPNILIDKIKASPQFVQSDHSILPCTLINLYLYWVGIMYIYVTRYTTMPGTTKV